MAGVFLLDRPAWLAYCCRPCLPDVPRCSFIRSSLLRKTSSCVDRIARSLTVGAPADRGRPSGWLFRSRLLTALADDEAKPAKKDTAAALKPSQATLTATVEPAEAKPGDTVTFKVTAKLDSGFHIYKYSKEQGEGPVPTSFDFFDRAGLETEGEWTASRDPEKHKDPNFPDLASVEYYEDEVTWSIKVKIPAATAAGKKTLRCQARYMICDAKTCSVPGRWTLPDVELTVTTGDAAPPAAKAKRRD